MLKEILVLFCGIYFVMGAPLIKEKKGDEIEVLKSTEHRYSDFYAFQYSLSDGQQRQELITFDDEDKNGISVRGSYTLQLEDGSTQTIFYVSDANGHRISIGQPFTESEITQKPIVSVRRAPPTRSTRKPEIERNAEKEEEKIEDHTEKAADDYESNEDGDDYEGASTNKKLLYPKSEGKRRKF